LAQEVTNASDRFEQIGGQARTGVFCPASADQQARTSAEATIRRFGLTEEQRFDPSSPSGSWGGFWGLESTDGYVGLKVQCPVLSDRSKNMSEVYFKPAVEQPTPQAILTQLFARAESTEVGGGDTLKLSWREKPVMPTASCLSKTTLTIRVGTGALLGNSLETYCDVSSARRPVP
jgi:hypothetical protein